MPSRQNTKMTKQKMVNIYKGKLKAAGVSVNNVEQLASVVGGGALLLFYLRKITLADALLAVTGGSLVYRGVKSGSIKINTAAGAKRIRQGLQDLAKQAKGWSQSVRNQVGERFKGQIAPMIRSEKRPRRRRAQKAA